MYTPSDYGSMMDSDELFKSLSALLGLEYQSQDWGYINSDRDRVEEYLDVYESVGPVLPASLKSAFDYEMTELIFKSAAEWLAVHSEFFGNEGERLKQLWDEIRKQHVGVMVSILLSDPKNEQGDKDLNLNRGAKELRELIGMP